MMKMVWATGHARCVGMLLLVLINGCSSHFTEAKTPEDAVKQYFIEHPITQDPRGIAYLSTHYFGDMAIVLYKAPIPDALYLGVAWRNEDIWYTKECCDAGGGSLFSHESMIEFGQDSIAPHGLVFWGSASIRALLSLKAPLRAEM